MSKCSLSTNNFSINSPLVLIITNAPINHDSPKAPYFTSHSLSYINLASLGEISSGLFHVIYLTSLAHSGILFGYFIFLIIKIF
jgi:hypothetical protein